MSDLATTRRRLPTLWADSVEVYRIGSVATALPAIGAGVVIGLRLPSDEFGITALVVLVAFIVFVCSLATVPWMAGKAYRAMRGVRSTVWRGVWMGVATVIASLWLFAPVIVFAWLLFLPLIGALISWSLLFVLFCRERPAAMVDPPVPAIFGRVSIRERRGGFDSIGPK